LHCAEPTILLKNINPKNYAKAAAGDIWLNLKTKI
jgi:hypothetical protein